MPRWPRKPPGRPPSARNDPRHRSTTIRPNNSQESTAMDYRDRIREPDMRRHRANELTSYILKELGDLLPREHRRAAAERLFDRFMADGYDIVTDAQRAAAGLAPRNDYGWTYSELQAL